MSLNIGRLRLEWRDFERGHLDSRGSMEVYAAVWEGLTPFLEEREPPAWSPTHVLFLAILLHQELELRALREAIGEPESSQAHDLVDELRVDLQREHAPIGGPRGQARLMTFDEARETGAPFREGDVAEEADEEEGGQWAAKDPPES